jgi:hypothetical protein
MGSQPTGRKQHIEIVFATNQNPNQKRLCAVKAACFFVTSSQNAHFTDPLSSAATLKCSAISGQRVDFHREEVNPTGCSIVLSNLAAEEIESSVLILSKKNKNTADRAIVASLLLLHCTKRRVLAAVTQRHVATAVATWLQV